MHSRIDQRSKRGNMRPAIGASIWLPAFGGVTKPAAQATTAKPPTPVVWQFSMLQPDSICLTEGSMRNRCIQCCSPSAGSPISPHPALFSKHTADHKEAAAGSRLLRLQQQSQKMT
jgi:hypothetical protein